MSIFYPHFTSIFVLLQLVVMIGVDLSKPLECRDNLLVWLRYLRFELERYFSASTEPDIAAKNRQLVSYLSSVRADSNMDEMRELLHNYGVPIIVVGCKSDCLTVKDLAELRRNEEAQRDIRHICSRGKLYRAMLYMLYILYNRLLHGVLCLLVGASLVYTSASNGQNCKVLKKYLLHRLYSELVPMKLAIEVLNLFVFVRFC